MNPPRFDRPGAWQGLFASALTLTDHLASVVRDPIWSFGGGTVLMLRLNHRHSKDIDLFVPDPQYLGHFSPRLTDAAEAVTTEYQEAAEYIKLFLEHGEIDIVVGDLARDEFSRIERIAYGRSFDECMELAGRILSQDR